MHVLTRLLICVMLTGGLLYRYIDHLNELTALKRRIPVLLKEVKEINERNLELQYEIEQFESPVHLMELARKPEFGYLKYPSIDEIIFLPEPSIEHDAPQ